MECKHRFCKKCINQYFVESLNELAVNEKIVGCPDCGASIIYHILDDVLEGEALIRYHRKLILYLENNDKRKVLKHCNKCDFAAFIPLDEEIFNCPVCEKSICAKCNRPYSETCCKRKSIVSVEELGGLIMRCPKCRCAIIKENGCNFLTFCWPNCEKVSFCFLCKKILNVFYM